MTSIFNVTLKQKSLRRKYPHYDKVKSTNKIGRQREIILYLLVLTIRFCLVIQFWDDSHFSIVEKS